MNLKKPMFHNAVSSVWHFDFVGILILKKISQKIWLVKKPGLSVASYWSKHSSPFPFVSFYLSLFPKFLLFPFCSFLPLLLLLFRLFSLLPFVIFIHFVYRIFYFDRFSRFHYFLSFVFYLFANSFLSFFCFLSFPFSFFSFLFSFRLLLFPFFSSPFSFPFPSLAATLKKEIWARPSMRSENYWNNV